MSLPSADVSDALIRAAAFDHVRNLSVTRDHLTADDLSAGFEFDGERIPLINPRRGIFKPRQMRYLLSIKTVFPKPGAKVWYDDQRTVHRQIFESSEMVDYAFMGSNPDAADNRWLREAYEDQIPIIYFIGTSPGRYLAFVDICIAGWSGQQLKAQVAFSPPARTAFEELEAPMARRYALQSSSATPSPGFLPRSSYRCLRRALRSVGLTRTTAT
jgi:putative restriction endonuclease